ncbi:MAG TPA: type IV pilin protein [Nevskiaceae bacterium]|nr:type IV pilin protein [Nevskiaceae bacterium]
MAKNGSGAMKALARGFTLIELLVAMAILAVLLRIAVSSYTSSVAKTKRRAAEACLANYGTYMERYYTTNLTYVGMDNTALTALGLDCASAAQTGSDYTYSFTATPTAAAFTLQAVPGTVQSGRDARCGTLTLDQTGNRGISGSSTVADCW